MLSDRNYMRDPFGEQRRSNAIKWVFVLIVINVIIYFFFQKDQTFEAEMLLSPMGIRDMKLWQVVTAMFLHGGFGHIFLNMWGLYLFGTIVAPELGTKRFLIMYFISGIAGNILWLAFNWNSYAFLLGASGAIFGILMATAMLFPDKQFLMLFFPVPIKAKTLVLVYGVIEILSNLSNDGIAHLAHLGGALAAYIFLKIIYKRGEIWDPLDFIFKKGSGSSRQSPHGWKVHPDKSKSNHYRGTGENVDKGTSSGEPVSQKELDRILDKISQSTINSLTQEENDTLKRAREQMKNRN